MIYALALLLGLLAMPLVAEARRKVMNAQARRGAAGEFATLSQGITHYQWTGPMRGPVAVCVHGLTTPSFVWQGVARGLAAMGFRVLTYDLYGRGYSDRVKGRQDRQFFVRQLDDLLQDQQIKGDITLLGYSMGAAIATAFSAAHSHMIRQLVLLAPAGIGQAPSGLIRFVNRTPVIGDWLMLAFFARTLRKGIEAERDLPGTVENIADLQLNQLEYRGFVAAVLSSMRGILSQPQEQEHIAIHQAGVPVMAVWGRKDDVIPLSDMGTLTKWSRHVRQDVIEDAGHGLVYTHTQQVLDTISDAMQDGLS